MIENQEQYDRTKEWARRFEYDADEQEKHPLPSIAPELQQAMIQAARAQAAELRQEMAVWDESHPHQNDSTKGTVGP